MKILFMGTPDFSVPVLKALKEAGHEIVLAVTQPDKPKGRGKTVQFSAVKAAAMELGIGVYQPRRIKDAECVAHLRTYDAELFVVAAFGQILSREILEMPKYGCINVHASLLPKYRGASPIQWAVINGEPITGVTIQQMDVGIDTGQILAKLEVPLDQEETGGSLFEKLAHAGAKLCVQTVAQIADGTVTRTKQEEALATHVGMIKKEMGRIDWHMPAVQIERLIRGLNPWPSAYTYLNGKMLKIWEADALGEKRPDERPAAACGQVLEVLEDGLAIQTGKGVLKATSLQLEGKKRLDAASFLRGFPVRPGMQLERSQVV